MTNDLKAPGPRKGRSPNYPGTDLGVAIQRAHQMYTLTRQHPINVNLLAEHWGYKPTSGQSGIVLAALNKFGLIALSGTGNKREARLTEDALALIRDERDDSTERDRLISKLALLPAIHRELWNQYEGELPSTDPPLRFHLIQRRRFTENGAEDFIGEFRRTVAFAKLTSSGKVDAEDPDEEGKHDDDTPDDSKNRQNQRRDRQPGMTVLSFQISDRLVEVSVSGGPLTKDEIEAIQDYLKIQHRLAPSHAPQPVADSFFADLHKADGEQGND